MTDKITLNKEKSLPAFKAAVKEMAARGRVVEYTHENETETHVTINFGNSWAAYMFDLGYWYARKYLELNEKF